MQIWISSKNLLQCFHSEICSLGSSVVICPFSSQTMGTLQTLSAPGAVYSLRWGKSDIKHLSLAARLALVSSRFGGLFCPPCSVICRPEETDCVLRFCVVSKAILWAVPETLALWCPRIKNEAPHAYAAIWEMSVGHCSHWESLLLISERAEDSDFDRWSQHNLGLSTRSTSDPEVILHTLREWPLTAPNSQQFNSTLKTFKPGKI